MMKRLACALAMLAAALPAAAQQSGRGPAGDSVAAPTQITIEGEPRLVFEREVYTYPAGARRDPFRPLTSTDSGPLFQDLQLRMILFSREHPGRSVVVLQDAAKKTHRLRRGDAVGSATVVDIGPRRVLFSVVEFGVRRQEVLELKPNNREGA